MGSHTKKSALTVCVFVLGVLGLEDHERALQQLLLGKEGLAVAQRLGPHRAAVAGGGARPTIGFKKEEHVTH